MLLKNKNAIIYGAAGAIGSAITETFVREGARVFMAGRNEEKLKQVAKNIAAPAGMIYTAAVDALDEETVNRHADQVAQQAGSIDISLNAIGIIHVQGRLFNELSLEDFIHPINAYTRSHFITAKAAAKHMVQKGSGVLLTISTPGSKLPGPGFMGYGVTCAAVEAITRQLAGELGAYGIRAICLRPDAIPEALTRNSHSKEVFKEPSEKAGIAIETMLEGHAQADTLLKRLPTLAEVANVAAFMASDRASAMTGTVANITCGSLVD